MQVVSSTPQSCNSSHPVKLLSVLGNVSILYYNARSMLRKIDDLAAACLSSNPDCICIVESWLCENISDNEISLPSYCTVRLDRNWLGDGIVMYIKDHINYNILHKRPSDFEFIFVSLCLCNNRSLYLGAFYRPPSSPISILNPFFDVLFLLIIFIFLILLL